MGRHGLRAARRRERPGPTRGDVLKLVAKVLTERAASAARTRRKVCRRSVEDTILRALAKEPRARFASMADVADALEPFASLSTGGDRVRITRGQELRGRPAAFAATTRVPTRISVQPAPPAEPKEPPRPTPGRQSAVARGAALPARRARRGGLRRRRGRDAPGPTGSVHDLAAGPSAPRPMSSVPRRRAPIAKR